MPTHECERIDGTLQQPRVIDLYVREDRHDGVQPLSAYLQFHTPEELSSRRIVYVEGRNRGKMLVRKGGKRLGFIVVHVDPDGWKAQAESLVPITQISLRRTLHGLRKIIQQQMELDPRGDNTEVEYTGDATCEGGHASPSASGIRTATRR